MTAGELVTLLAWGLLVGLDLVSVPQIMIARPLVAATAAGALLGDLETGLRVGMLLELFQLDVLPVGAARYPEFGPASVAATVAAHQVPGLLGLGLGALVGLALGALGGVSIHAVRKLNARAIRRAAAALETGDPVALVRLHIAALARDAGRALIITGLGLGLAALAAAAVPGTLTLYAATRLGAAAVGVALAAGFHGALRVAGQGAPRGLFALGALGGIAVAVLR